MADKPSEKTIRKNKVNSLNESIARVESDITLYKAEGNRTALLAAEKVLKCLKSMLDKYKNRK